MSLLRFIRKLLCPHAKESAALPPPASYKHTLLQDISHFFTFTLETFAIRPLTVGYTHRTINETLVARLNNWIEQGERFLKRQYRYMSLIVAVNSLLGLISFGLIKFPAASLWAASLVLWGLLLNTVIRLVLNTRWLATRFKEGTFSYFTLFFKKQGLCQPYEAGFAVFMTYYASLSSLTRRSHKVASFLGLTPSAKDIYDRLYPTVRGYLYYLAHNYINIFVRFWLSYIVILLLFKLVLFQYVYHESFAHLLLFPFRQLGLL